MLDKAAVQPLRDELRWMGEELGAARDAEVVRDRLRDLVAAEPPELVLGPVERRIVETYSTRYRAAHDELLGALDGDRYGALLDTLDALVTRPPLGAAAGDSARIVYEDELRRTYRRARGLVRDARAAEDPHRREELLHEVRKAAKRARYAAEAATGVLGGQARRYGKAMKAVQEVLGEHQDSVVPGTSCSSWPWPRSWTARARSPTGACTASSRRTPRRPSSGSRGSGGRRAGNGPDPAGAPGCSYGWSIRWARSLAVEAGQCAVDLAGDVALEAADDLGLGDALGGASLDVGAGAWVAAQAAEDDAVEGGVGLAVAAAVEPVRGLFARGGGDRGDAAERGEGGFGVSRSGLSPAVTSSWPARRADAVEGDQGGGERGHQLARAARRGR